MAEITINGVQYFIIRVLADLTVPDCFVVKQNKVGGGHGEKKYYVCEKDSLKDFFGEFTQAKCIALKRDFQIYLNTVREEYFHPTLKYGGKRNLKSLWTERVEKIDALDDCIEFDVSIQEQISGRRGYINSKSSGYNLFRELSLPYVSYVSLMRLQSSDGETIFYWRLFVDFDALRIKGLAPLALIYGRKNKVRRECFITTDASRISEKERRSASRQSKFRDELLKECHECPITGITTHKLLIASHIKPARVSTTDEEKDPKNGFLLSPLYDRLFDQGLVTFDAQKKIMVSPWLTADDQERCKVAQGTIIERLPLDSKRAKYLEYHREWVFKGA